MSGVADWDKERQERRSLEAQLPAVFRRILSKVRDESLRHELLAGIQRDVLAQVRGGNVEETDDPWVNEVSAEVNRLFGPPCEIDDYGPLGGRRPTKNKSANSALFRSAAKVLAADWSYMNRFEMQVRMSLRRAHRVQAGPESVTDFPDKISEVRPVEGRLLVKSSIGLGTASRLDAEPEGWDAWAVQEIGRRFDGYDDHGSIGLDGQVARALVIHPRGGGFARAVAAREAPVPPIEVYEADGYEPATRVPCLVARGPHVLDSQYDFVVCAFPSPSTPEAAGQTRIYGDSSSLGSRRWLNEFKGILHGCKEFLVVGGVALVLVPLGERTARGFRPVASLAADVDRVVNAATGVTVIENYPTEEIEPVSRPFVRKSRPEMVTYVIRRES